MQALRNSDFSLGRDFPFLSVFFNMLCYNVFGCRHFMNSSPLLFSAFSRALVAVLVIVLLSLAVSWGIRG